MRLIDADVLKARIEQEEDREYDATGYLLHMTDSLPVIDNAPTIEAIPVEWLRVLCDIMRRQSSRAAADMLSRVIDLWRQEQEARE